MSEAHRVFDCFGARCAALVSGDGALGSARAAAAAAQEDLLAGHARFSRFEPGSELSRLNADARETVPVSPEMARFAAAATTAARRTGGLVDATVLPALVRAGYARDLSTGVPLRYALDHTPDRRPARAHPAECWRDVTVDRDALTVTRPPGIALDSGGIVKGLLADLMAPLLDTHAAYAIDCAGDLRVGGTARLARQVHVECPFTGSVLHTFELRAGAIATSGVGRRSWLDPDGRPAHHLIDPATGRPAWTGIVQATALAPTAFDAELRAKAALLSGPAGAHEWLADGGLLVADDGSRTIVEPASRVPALSSG